jgi:predicted amidophosphoribosyltransferase
MNRSQTPKNPKQLVSRITAEMLNMSSTLLEGGRQWIFPQLCIVCGRLRTDTTQNRDLQGMCCPVCESKGFDLAGTLDRVLPEGLQSIQTAFPFVRDGPLQEMVHALKYQIRPDVGQQLGRMMAIHRMDLWMNECTYSASQCLLIPVPIHWKRRIGRGYNQSEAITRGIQTVFPDMAVLPRGVFVRWRSTRTQTKYSEQKRAQNIRVAFKVNERTRTQIQKQTRTQTRTHTREEVEAVHAYRPVWILVDDVFTSGATIFECASVLHRWITRDASTSTHSKPEIHAWVVGNAEDGS